MHDAESWCRIAGKAKDENDLKRGEGHLGKTPYADVHLEWDAERSGKSTYGNNTICDKLRVRKEGVG